MNTLPEDLLFLVYKRINTIDVIPELEEMQKERRIEQCVRSTPIVKSLSFISVNSKVDIQKTTNVVNNHRRICKHFNNLYNITLYYHLDNFLLI